MGRFQKGEGGRPKGKPNKINSELKNWIYDFLHNHKNQFESDFLELSPRDRVLMFEKMIKYILPIEKNNDVDDDFIYLSDSQLSEIIEKLQKNDQITENNQITEN